MVEEPDNINPQFLRHMDAKIDRLTDDVQDMKVRLTLVEKGLVGVHRRRDRFENRLDRLEGRLNLVGAPHL